jgi:hypothetical protein
MIHPFDMSPSLTVMPRLINSLFAVLGPLTRTTKETLNITNPNGHDIAFKVKTTAPKLYCVRPNAGVVPSGQSLEVQGK